MEIVRVHSSKYCKVPLILCERVLDFSLLKSKISPMKIPLFLSVLFSLIFIYCTPAHAGKKPAEMVLIPKGCFMMGSDRVIDYEEGRPNDRERPVHKVCLDAFYLDETEATQERYEKIIGETPSTLTGSKDWPVDHVSHEKASEFCSFQGKRLPTEAEWEYAARAGSKTEYPWGKTLNRDYLWYSDNSLRTQHPVGSKKPNAWGVHDMLGSVWEWVSDWYSENYYQTGPVKNPQGPKARRSFHPIRGGSWVDDEHYIRVSARMRGDSDMTLSFLVGFRCARGLNITNK